MIVTFWEEDGETIFMTEGCGCCSKILTIKKNKKEIIKHIKQNEEFTKELKKIVGC